MAQEQSIMDKMMDLFFKIPKSIKETKIYRITFYLYENNAIGYAVDDLLITKFYASAKTKDGRIINTQNAKFKKFSQVDNVLKVIFEEDNLRLTQTFLVNNEETFFTTYIEIEDIKGNVIESNYLKVMDFSYPDKEVNQLFCSLDQKMLLIPYDNDMWVRYESSPLKPGRTSYEVTCIYDDITLSGMLIGALDFDIFKNAIKCSDHDARCYYALSGIADEGTHDVAPHGYIDGKIIKSSRFMCGWFSDIRDALDIYGKKAMEDKHKLSWANETIYGWNSYSAGCMTLEQWEEAGKFLNKEVPNFSDSLGVTYINLDANFMLNKNKMRKIVDSLHSNGQKAGNYLAPALGAEMMEMINPLKGTKGAKYKDIMMKFEDGTVYPKIDSGIPVDVTNPIFIKHLEECVKEIVDMGFDYLKVDFTSHAGVEGKRYDPSIKTGRQALNFFYKTLNDLLDEDKIGRKIFLDFSISPLFPGGYAHARRASCDAFGHHDDVKYVLNALNYGFWQSGSIYEFNDPDHTVLFKSRMDNKGISEYNTAKSRYLASIISGTVMLLSDNYGPYGKSDEVQEARNRTIKLANNRKLNDIALLKKPFIPAYMNSETSNVYFLHHDNKHYLAVFNFNNYESVFNIDLVKLQFNNCGVLKDILSETTISYHNKIEVKLDAYDSVIFELIE